MKSNAAKSWDTIRLGEIVRIKTGKLDANASSADGEFPFFTCSKEPLKISTFSYECECVLVAGNGDLNVKYYNGKFDAYQRTYIVECSDNTKLHARYLYYFLDSYLEKLREQSIGGVIKYIKLENLTEVQIPLPPLATQKRIAEILDAADTLRRKDQELLKKYDELAQAIFIDMFGDPVKNEKGWERKAATDYYEVRGRVGWKGYKKTDLRLNGAIVLGATHVTNTGEIDLTKVVYLSQEKFNESPEITVQKDDLIFVQRGNTIGKVALIREDLGDATINPVVLIFRPVNANPLFLLYLILNKEQNRELVNSNSGSAQPMITQEFMRKYFYIDIERDDQEEFAKRIEITEGQKAKARISCNESEFLFLTLIQKAFKGELVS